MGPKGPESDLFSNRGRRKGGVGGILPPVRAVPVEAAIRSPDWNGANPNAAPRSRSHRRDGETPIQIYGNTQGLKAGQVKRLDRLFRRRLPADRLITNELARELTEVSREIRYPMG